MYELKSHLPKSVVLVIILAIFSITVSGYILFFQAQKRNLSKDREYELLKQQQIHAQENYSDLQKKDNENVKQLKQSTKDYDTILQKQQECKEKQEELQIKYDELFKANEKIAQQLKALTNPSTTAIEPPPVTPSPKTISPPHQKPIAPSKNESHVSLPLSQDSYQCPSADIVTRNVANGSWTDKKLTWFVDYVSRPLNDKEPIKQLYKILYDGQTIACYYNLGTNTEGASMVIKGGTKTKITLAEKDGWNACSNEDCQSLCGDDSLQRCHFIVAP